MPMLPDRTPCCLQEMISEGNRCLRHDQFFVITEGVSKEPNLDKIGCQGPAQGGGASQGSVKDGKT